MSLLWHSRASPTAGGLSALHKMFLQFSKGITLFWQKGDFFMETNKQKTPIFKSFTPRNNTRCVCHGCAFCVTFSLALALLEFSSKCIHFGFFPVWRKDPAIRKLLFFYVDGLRNSSYGLEREMTCYVKYVKQTKNRSTCHKSKNKAYQKIHISSTQVDTWCLGQIWQVYRYKNGSIKCICSLV